MRLDLPRIYLALVLGAACAGGGLDTSLDDGGAPGPGDSPDAGAASAVDAVGGGGGTPGPDSNLWPDEPVEWCGPPGTQPPPPPPPTVPGCDGDRNREGCPCTTVGETAACWPGRAINRNRGICRDGVTTCVQDDTEFAHWGPCLGYVLPDPTATRGPSACTCFSGGQWRLENLSPCFVTYQDGRMFAVSTYVDGAGQAHCPTNISATPPPAPQPGTTWSRNTLTVDCAGHFRLCYTLKAGDAAAPQPTDCTVTTVCTEADYPTANVAFPMPDLPAWTGADPACAARFANQAGYGEMSVVGLSVECDEVDDGAGQPYVFNRVKYCPLSCNTNPTAPECVGCMQGGGGSF